MGEQRNLTEKNVEELKKHLKRLKEANSDLEYAFFMQSKQKYCKDCDEHWPPKANFCSLCGKKI